MLKIFKKIKIIFFDDWEIESSDQHINLKDAIDLILDFNKNKNEDEDDETIEQNEIKKLNDYFDKIIDKSKSFEEQIKSLKKREDLKGYWPYNDYDDKELKSKYFKIKLADMSNEIDEKLFEKIFSHTLIKLVDKPINTANKGDNQIIIKNIDANKKNFKNEKKRSVMVM